MRVIVAVFTDTVNNDNGMNMVGHDDKPIDIDARIMGRDFIPNRLRHNPRIVQPHFPIHNPPEQA